MKIGHTRLRKKKYYEIKYLTALKFSDGLFASDFVKMSTEKDDIGVRICESTVFNYLEEFQKEGILYYDKVTKKYYATNKAKARFATEQMFGDLQNLPEWMFELGREVLETANQQIREESKSIERINTLIKLWGKWISAIALYCLGKEIETGQSFWFVLANYLTYVGGSHAFLLRHIIYRATPDIEIPELMKLGRKGVAFGKKEAYAEEVASYFKNLRQSYPAQIALLEKIFQKKAIISYKKPELTPETIKALERLYGYQPLKAEQNEKAPFENGGKQK